MAGTFNVGDIVTLKSGGPKMTVTGTDKDVFGNKIIVWTTWFAGSKSESSSFPEEALVIAPPTEPKPK
jgi:uncharacterized protein YodC (DUF2158 family)